MCRLNYQRPYVSVRTQAALMSYHGKWEFGAVSLRAYHSLQYTIMSLG